MVRRLWRAARRGRHVVRSVNPIAPAPTNTSELLLVALVAAVQLLSLLVSEVLSRHRQRSTIAHVKRENAELVRQVSARPPPIPELAGEPVLELELGGDDTPPAVPLELEFCPRCGEPCTGKSLARCACGWVRP
jgi:hypothetical protein